MFFCFEAIILGAESAGTIFSFAGDMGKAKQAAQILRTLFDRIPQIDASSAEGYVLDQINGNVGIHDIHFRYPARPQQPVFSGLNLDIKPGEFVALVGNSGSGKSTVIALIERFYDPCQGKVSMDGADISSFCVSNYRSHLALVMQEPILYQRSLRDNIALGAEAHISEISDEKIMQACKDANIFDFVASLPEGLQTVMGPKGRTLSGGQKQRITIARALIRDPRVLLLDEATSSLDSRSVKPVLEALDAAAKARTTIAVAHQLSTIQKADRIYLIHQGRIAESGTHQQLMQLKGMYFELAKLQSLPESQEWTEGKYC